MEEHRATKAPASIWTFALLGLVTLFTVVALRFAAGQSVWTDEATQLSGLSLGFADQLRWLAGRMPHAFTVPIDRTPPLSYWLGSLWTQAFGTNVLTARCLSVCLSVASIFVLWMIARQYLDHGTALVCSALLALSPNFVVEAAEIRPYAAFIFSSTLFIYCYVRLVCARPTPSTLDLWAFSLAATLSSYTHFFGIVISAGALLSLLGLYIPATSRTGGQVIVRKAIWPLLFYLVTFIGLIPFILGAVNNSRGPTLGTAAVALPWSIRLHELVKLVYRLFSHQSMLGSSGLSAAALLAGLALLGFSAIPGSNPRAKQLLLFLLVNLVLVTLMGLTTSAFNALSPSYNVWALPLTALISGAALTHRNLHIRAASVLCVSILIAADCYAAARLSTAGELYGHTRSTVVKNVVDRAGPADVIVLYSNDAPGLYFAMIYDYRARLRQYIPRGSAVHLIGTPDGDTSSWICDQNADTLVVAGDHELSADALQSLIARPGMHSPAYPALDEFLAAHRTELASRWDLVSEDEYLAQSALAIAVFKHREVGDSPLSADCTKH